jgi:uncharacterized protein YrrD
LGKVREWLLDEHGTAAIAFVAEGSGWLPQRRMFFYRDILRLGPDAVLVNREGSHPVGEPPEANGKPTLNVLGRRVISDSGSELGVVEDVLLEEETGRVTGWRLSSGLIDDILEGRQVVEAPQLLSIGEDVVIIQE